MNNLAYAARTLRKNSGFTLTVLIVLALGIGGNVAIFSVVNAVLLRPLPYANPERLVLLWGNVQRNVVERRGTSLPDYRDWKEQNRTFDGLASFWDARFTMRGAEERVPVQAEVVGSQYFNLLGVKPVVGREFRSEEETDSSLPAVAILAHGLWTQRFGSDQSVIGKTVTLDSLTYTIVGVMPRGFRGIGDRAELWVPTGSLPERLQNYKDRATRGLVVLGRLRSEVSLAQAQSNMDEISKGLERAYLSTNEKRGVEVAPLVQETFGRVRQALLVLLGAVSLVLLIACANVANLMLLRTEKRHSELAIRAAVGASRGELLKVILSETVLLSVAGAVGGLFIAGWAVDLILAISPIQLPSFVSVTLDRNVILFTTALAAFTAVTMAIAPLLQFAPADLHEALTSNSARTAGGRSTRRFRNALVIGEVALSFVLLLTAGFLAESFRQMLRVDTGFEPSHLLTLRLNFESDTATKAAAVKEALERLPSVKSVALSSVIPFSPGAPAFFYSAEGVEPSMDPSTTPRAIVNFVAPGFFRTMGIPLRNGRDFDAKDGEGAVIVSDNLVQRFWPGQNAIGKRIRIGRNNPDNPWMSIVGVVGNTKTRGIPENPTSDPDMYLSFSRFGGSPGVLIRTEMDASRLIPVALNEIKRQDKLAVVSNVSTVEDLMRPGTARMRFLSSLSVLFSGMALILALVGIYGSISYTVAQRRREFGIRMALGADRRSVLRMVLGRSLVLIGGGLAFGFLGSAFASRGISAFLFGISATAPSVFIAVSVLMIVTGLGAAYIPAHRASRVDPLVALRQE